MASLPPSPIRCCPTVPAQPAAAGKGRHRRHANPFSVRSEPAALDATQHFDRRAPLALDIGCGPGAFVAALADAAPQYNVLGMEIRPHLVAQGRALLQATNARHADVWLANANLHLHTLIADNSVAFVSINFPDPWFKNRHHKRRVVTEQMLRVLSSKLMRHAQVHVMTDYEPLAHAMRRTFLRAGYIDQHGPRSWPEQSTTKLQSEREAWHLSRGDRVWRMQFAPPAGAPGPHPEAAKTP